MNEKEINYHKNNVTECPLEGWWIFKLRVHDWDKWEKVDEKTDDVSTLSRTSYKHSIFLERKCKRCGYIEITEESTYS